jgi:predicted transcriptional regulator
MKENIIERAADMFITLGFKSVTMDDIANEMGISKKTIYTHFKNKTELIGEVTHLLFDKISCGIDRICETHKNPIEELYEIKKFVMLQLKDEKSSPQYQLQKYYPQIAESLKKKQHEVMKECTLLNLKRGKEMGLYRENIDIGFVSRIYYVGVMGIKDDSLFPVDIFPKSALLSEYLEYHLRGIVTKQGLKTLKKIINQQSN